MDVINPSSFVASLVDEFKQHPTLSKAVLICVSWFSKAYVNHVFKIWSFGVWLFFFWASGWDEPSAGSQWQCFWPWSVHSQGFTMQQRGFSYSVSCFGNPHYRSRFLSFLQAVHALCNVKMGRSRPELVSLAIRQYSQDCRLLPFGITMDMPCAEAWGLKQAYALLKLVTCLRWTITIEMLCNACLAISFC